MLIIHILQQSMKLICNSVWITWFQHIMTRCLQLLPPNSLLRQRWQHLLKRLSTLQASDENLAVLPLKTHFSGNRCSAAGSDFLKNTALWLRHCTMNWTLLTLYVICSRLKVVIFPESKYNVRSFRSFFMNSNFVIVSAKILDAE